MIRGTCHTVLAIALFLPLAPCPVLATGRPDFATWRTQLWPDAKRFGIRRATFDAAKEDTLAWYRHWLHHGFETLEELLRRRPTATPFCYDEKPTFGDIYLVPQLYNAQLRGLDLSAYPLLTKIDERCRALPAFDKAMPENQPDYPG